MRLSHIKLAGFKSFVDPTTIHVAGQLVAVCGPNGCGKSNVIDAVRWVLGESSAKQLRGESMQDVIFNGSTSRKPVSRASVELVFDNREGLAAGQWSQYAEISIKRVLTRQGDSDYYINNLAVRRRDITDLFLGTGVGKGGYAIIEQGMISRIIEAKPDELRHFLEEAAGVSKYKERRRETESRLADTRDNLARIDDIRQELGAQVERLQAQAEVAAEYQRLQQGIVEQQNLLALQRKLDAGQSLEQVRGSIGAAQNALEAQLAALRAHEASIVALREQHHAAGDQVQLAQTALYEANTVVAQLEQRQMHQRQTRERLQQLAGASREQLARLEQQGATLTDDLAGWQMRRDDADAELDDAMLELEEVRLLQPQVDDDAAGGEQAQQVAREQLSSAHARVALARQQLQHHEQAETALAIRLARLSADAAGGDDDEAGLVAQRDEAENLRRTHDDLGMAISQREEALALTRADLAQRRAEREALALARADAAARLAALGIEHEGADVADWLEQTGLAAAPLLLDSLDVDAEWATALEAVLGDALKGHLTESVPDLAAPVAATVLQRQAQGASRPSLDGLQPLAARVALRDPALKGLADALLGSAYCVDELAVALARRVELPEGACFVTPEGHLVDALRVRYHAASGDAAGMVQRRQARSDAELALATLAPALAAAELAGEKAEYDAAGHEAALKSQRQQQAAAQQRLQAQMRELAKHESAATERRTRREAASQAWADVTGQHEHAVQARQAAADELQAAEATLPPLQQQAEAAAQARKAFEAAAATQRELLRKAEHHAQSLRFAAQSARDRLTELAHRREALAEQVAQVGDQLEQQLIELDETGGATLDGEVQLALDVRREHELGLAAARDALNGVTQSLDERDADRRAIATALDPAREALAALKLQEQEARLAYERHAEALVEAGADEAALLAKLGNGARVQRLAAEITRMTQALEALGAVNLAALAELESAQERAGYLGAQAQDLASAVEMLEAAIRRIDRETRSLLQETYGTVNANLQALFPALFGGGHAELHLTGDEILDAGLQIMAQPPGKKNSTIHLLSGGEKALTALSLVFSLFRLNPAPFCLLDEVDAPLDDANTLRFCNLVKTMAERTQFLYISHNRLTMEMAEQLVGVTMQEQGVSRVVAVDIQQALTMRDAALAT
ncbi:chromosome segregation protein SMC [Jeongeupia sp. USM3]|uniref:chromosome segregation protein SMC n=1 Tax=Jeongeupia sp. USM3 TaxID=1906741 RepID=UPI00089DEEBF|nr:chromosome segregation protein SMC [Jeongeupia sp. USM3]AOX99291.1 chromosome segregation protein SMC [Jeongeupia sp. USM3]